MMPIWVSPEEEETLTKYVKMYDDFLAAHGYKWQAKCNYWTKPNILYQAFDGNYYTAKEMLKKTGYYPQLIKDGLHYGYFQPEVIHGFTKPAEDAENFILSKGYTRLPLMDEENFKNNWKLETEHYATHGYVPQWIKDGKTYGGTQILELEGYVYPWQPATPQPDKYKIGVCSGKWGKFVAKVKRLF